MKKSFLLILPVFFVTMILACSKFDDLELKKGTVGNVESDNLDASSNNQILTGNGRLEKIKLEDLESDVVRTLDKSKKTLSKDEVDVLQKCGFGGGIVRVFNSLNKSNGRRFIEYEIDGDSFIEQDELFKIAKNKNGRQFRTNQLVSKPRVIRVTGLNFESYNPYYTSIFRDALINAVNRYNALNLGLTFEADFKPVRNQQESTNLFMAKVYGIAVSISTNGYADPSSAGGRAGSPYSGGKPYDMVFVYPGTKNYGVGVVTWVMIHEIGHCIGLRHTDFFNRSISCGRDGNEGSGSDGAIHIPGTPNQTNIDMNSIMLSCFNGSEQGIFSSSDEYSLKYLYQ